MSTNKSISRIFSVLLVIVFMLAVTPLHVANATGVRYAKPTASGTGDCLSWANACTLQTALTGAASGDEIWAAAGTYKPTTGTDRTATFQLKSGVGLFGGFDGTETARTQRNPAANVIILSGDVKGDDNSNFPYYDPYRADNSYHVVTGATGATLDGFTITAGNANGVNPNDRGGGMYNDSSSPTLTNVTFSRNLATNSGGGMYNDETSSPTLTDVTFNTNSADYAGGGIYNYSNCNPTLTNVTFSRNSAPTGGGMFNNGSSPTLTNVTFSDNLATNSGGGMFNYDYSSPTLTNVTFSSNSATNGGGMSNVDGSPTLTNVTFSSNSAVEGGGMYNSSSVSTLTNVTFSGNSADYGGGMYNYYSNPTLTNVTFSGNVAINSGGGMYNYFDTQQIRNTIFWDNTAPNGAQIYNNSGTPSVSDSIVQDGYAGGTNIITTDPRLGILGNYGGSTQTIPLLAGSSAIDAGNDATCPATDQRGITRPQGAHCDIGAYEYDHTVIYYIYYAKLAASGTGDCSSWANACTIQTALTDSDSGDEIWVAAGTYKPTTGTDRTATFQLKSGVGLFGGFAGTETARTQRNPAANVTILSGDIDNNDSQTPIITDLTTVTGNSTNSYHVVTGATDATLDGFTITAGDANGSYPNDRGSGMTNSYSDPTLTNVSFNGNSADYGGGMYNWYSNPTLMDVTFSNNSATSGGGMANNNYSHPTLTNVTFNDNSARYGGGMYNAESSPTLTNVTFTGNSAINTGGGMYNTSSDPTLTNATFRSNSAVEGGGMSNDYSNPTLTNVTFSGNSASYGGGMYNYFGTPQIRNTIFWGNTAPSGAQIYNNSGTPSVSDSIVNGDCPVDSTCTNIITTDPRLGILGNFGGFTQTIPLLPGSSAIDAGNDATCPATDQRGVVRPQGAHCDIGAYEYDHTVIYYIYYAKPTASGTGDCSSWANACTLQTALTDADSGDEIWAAAGTYKPTTDPANRDATFKLIAGVSSLYGGFAGTETERDQRNPAANVTTLSGDIDNNDSQTPIITDLTTVTGNSTNSYHVVTGAAGATLDGFTITAGDANGSYPNEGGSGMINSYSDPTLTNVSFSGNSADYGGGMINWSSNPTLTDVTFSNNSALSGGGMYNQSSNPTLTDVTFSGNSVNAGGGMSNFESSPTLTNVTFTGNSAINTGGGMYNAGGGDGSGDATLTNVTFSGNTAGDMGGGMYSSAYYLTLTNVTFSSNSAVEGGGMSNVDGSPTLTNVTFSSNSAVEGGGMYNYFGTPQIRNTIFWGNTAPSGAQIYNNSGTPRVNDSIVNGGCHAQSTCTNIITTDPRLGILSNYGGFTQTIPLLANSSAINTGNDAVCPATDQRGVARPQGVHCDIGAFELVDNTPPDTSIDSQDPATNPTNNTSMTFTFSGTDTDSGVKSFECDLDGGGFAACASPKSYACLADRSHTFLVRAIDLVGNVDASPASHTWTVDKTAPTVVSSVSADANPTSASSVNFTVTFSEDVTGVAASDLALTKTGTISGASITGVSGSPIIYTVSINTGSGNGTIRLDVPFSVTITDLAGNPLANLPYTGGETYTVNKVFTIFLPLILR